MCANMSSLRRPACAQNLPALQADAYKAGDVIVTEGESGGKFFIVKSGEVKCTRSDSTDEVSDRLKEGSYFGEIALLLNDVRQATVTAVTDTTCLTIDRKVFKRLLGPLEDVLKKNMSLYEKYVTPKASGK